MSKRILWLCFYILIAFLLLMIVGQSAPLWARSPMPALDFTPALASPAQRWHSLASPSQIQTPFTDTEQLPATQELVWSEPVTITQRVKHSQEYFNVQTLLEAEGRLYAATETWGGVFVSQDDGETWEFAGHGLPDDASVDSLVALEGLLYAATWNEVFMSQDGGDSWQSIGEQAPTRIASLQAVNGRLYAGTWEKLFVSEDGGDNWLLRNEGLPNAPVQDVLAVGGRLYARTTDGIFVSADEGTTWQTVNAGLSTVPVESLVIAEEQLYVGTSDGLFVSKEGGANWQRASEALDDWQANSLLANDGRLYIGTTSGEVFVSQNGGSSWQLTGQGLPNTAIESLTAIEDRLYAITQHGAFVNQNSGQSWQPLNRGLTNGFVHSLLSANGRLYAGTANGLFVRKDGYTTWQLASPSLTNLSIVSLLEANGRLYAGTQRNGIWFSQDGGTTWQSASDDLANVSILSLLEADGRLYAGTGGDGVWISQDSGYHWQPAGKEGLTSLKILSLLAFDGRLYAGSLNRLFVSQDGGTTWRPPNEALTTSSIYSLLEAESKLHAIKIEGSIKINYEDNSLQVAGNDIIDSAIMSLLWFERRLYAQTDGGEVFIGLDIFKSYYKNSYLWNYTCFKLGPQSNYFAYYMISGCSHFKILNNNNLLYAGTQGRGLFTSADGGMTWQPSSGSSFRYESEETYIVDILTLSSDPDDPSALLAGTDRGVYRSLDGGQSWNNSIPTIPFEVYSLIENPQSGGQLWYGAGAAGLFRSDDGGESWSKFGTGLPVGTIHSLVINPEIATTLYAGTDKGVYKSTDGGVSWSRSGSFSSPIRSLLLDRHDAQIVYAATDDALYQSQNSGETWQSVLRVPRVYELVQTKEGAVYAASEDGLYRYTASSGQSEQLLPGDIRSFALDPAHTNFLYVGTSGGMLLSTDRGQSWNNAGLPEVVSKLYVIPATRSLYAITEKGLVRASLLEPSPLLLWPWLLGLSGLVVMMVGGVFSLARNSGLPAGLLVRQRLALFEVGLGYRDYRLRWQSGTPLERLIILLAPADGDLEGKELEKALAGLEVPAKREQLEAELDTALHDGLLLRRGGGYRLATPVLARALQAHEGLAGQQALAQQIRHEHPLCANARRFLERAGFSLDLVAPPLIYRGQPPQNLQRLLPAVVYMRLLPNQRLDGNQVLMLRQRIKELDQAADVVFAITDLRPTDQGWAQIGTLRMAQFTTLPLESALINEGLATGRERRLLRTEIEKRLGTSYDPYDMRDPVAGAFSFFGREALVENLLRRITEGRPVGIFALRKLGKSSLLQALRDRAPFPVAVVNLQTVGQESLQALYRRILGYWAQWTQVRYQFRWQPPEIPPDAPTDAFVSATLDLLDQLEQRQEGAQLGLFLDEVELIVPRADGSGPSLSRYLTLLRALRGLVDEDGRLALVVASLNPAINRINAWQGEQNPTFSLFQEVHLPPLAQEDCIQMVRNIGQQIGLVYSAESVQQIYDLSGGHPFLARQLCSLLYQLRDRQGGQIELSELHKGIHHFIYDPSTITHLEAGIWQDVGNVALWGSLNASVNQTVLLELARAATPLPAQQLTGAPDADARQTALINLERYHIIHQPTPDNYAIHFGLLRQWLRRRQLGLE